MFAKYLILPPQVLNYTEGSWQIVSFPPTFSAKTFCELLLHQKHMVLQLKEMTDMYLIFKNFSQFCQLQAMLALAYFVRTAPKLWQIQNTAVANGKNTPTMTQN